MNAGVTVSHELAAIAKKGRRRLRRRVLRSAIGPLSSSPLCFLPSDGGAWESPLAAWENRSLSLPSFPLSVSRSLARRSIGVSASHSPFGRREEESIAFDGCRTTIGFERASGGACLTSDRIGAEVEGDGGAETIIGGAGTKERDLTGN